jgi:hypothetical protein
VAGISSNLYSGSALKCSLKQLCERARPVVCSSEKSRQFAAKDWLIFQPASAV